MTTIESSITIFDRIKTDTLASYICEDIQCTPDNCILKTKSSHCYYARHGTEKTKNFLIKWMAKHCPEELFKRILP